MRAHLRETLRSAVRQVNEYGFDFSEQRLMRLCLRLALRLWRGKRGMAARNRRYNNRLGPYVIVPFYSTEMLRCVSTARCRHAGVSLSRLMDFAIDQYLPRIVEEILSGENNFHSLEDAKPWKEKYSRRRPVAGFVISYSNLTQTNDEKLLDFSERTEIHPWPPPWN